MARPVERWLETFMCGQYAETFEAYGFKTLQSVCQLDYHHLRNMGVLPEHTEKILENVSVLRQSYMGGMGPFGDNGGPASGMGNSGNMGNHGNMGNPGAMSNPMRNHGNMGNPSDMANAIGTPGSMGNMGNQGAYMNDMSYSGQQQSQMGPGMQSYSTPYNYSRPMPGGSMAGGSMAGGSMAGGSMAGGSMPGGSMPGGSMPGGSMPGGSMPGGPMATAGHMGGAMGSMVSSRSMAMGPEYPGTQPGFMAGHPSSQFMASGAQMNQQPMSQHNAMPNYGQQSGYAGPGRYANGPYSGGSGPGPGPPYGGPHHGHQGQMYSSAPSVATSVASPNNGMVPRHHHLRQATVTTQTPQQVADSILQMASSSYQTNGTVPGSGPMAGPVQHPFHRPAMQQGPGSPQHTQMMGNPGYNGMRNPGPQAQYMGYQGMAPMMGQNCGSPLSPMQVRSPVAGPGCMPCNSPGPLCSPANLSECSPGTAPNRSPGLPLMRSPNMHQQPAHSPMGHMPGHSPHSHPPGHSPLGPPSIQSPNSCVQSPLGQPVASPMSCGQPLHSPLGSIHSPHGSLPTSSPSHPGGVHVNTSTLTSPPRQHFSPAGHGSPGQYPSGANFPSSAASPYHSPAQSGLPGPGGGDPLQSLQKLVMLPESQVVDPKSVVNDACLAADGNPSDVTESKNGLVTDEVGVLDSADNYVQQVQRSAHPASSGGSKTPRSPDQESGLNHAASSPEQPSVGQLFAYNSSKSSRIPAHAIPCESNPGRQAVHPVDGEAEAVPEMVASASEDSTNTSCNNSLPHSQPFLDDEGSFHQPEHTSPFAAVPAPPSSQRPSPNKPAIKAHTNANIKHSPPQTMTSNHISATDVSSVSRIEINAPHSPSLPSIANQYNESQHSAITTPGSASVDYEGQSGVKLEPVSANTIDAEGTATSTSNHLLSPTNTQSFNPSNSSSVGKVETDSDSKPSPSAPASLACEQQQAMVSEEKLKLEPSAGVECAGEVCAGATSCVAMAETSLPPKLPPEVAVPSRKCKASSCGSASKLAESVGSHGASVGPVSLCVGSQDGEHGASTECHVSSPVPRDSSRHPRLMHKLNLSPRKCVSNLPPSCQTESSMSGLASASVVHLNGNVDSSPLLVNGHGLEMELAPGQPAGQKSPQPKQAPTSNTGASSTKLRNSRKRTNSGNPSKSKTPSNSEIVNKLKESHQDSKSLGLDKLLNSHVHLSRTDIVLPQSEDNVVQKEKEPKNCVDKSKGNEEKSSPRRRSRQRSRRDQDTVVCNGVIDNKNKVRTRASNSEHTEDRSDISECAVDNRSVENDMSSAAAVSPSAEHGAGFDRTSPCKNDVSGRETAQSTGVKESLSRKSACRKQCNPRRRERHSEGDKPREEEAGSQPSSSSSSPIPLLPSGLSPVGSPPPSPAPVLQCEDPVKPTTQNTPHRHSPLLVDSLLLRHEKRKKSRPLPVSMPRSVSKPESVSPEMKLVENCGIANSRSRRQTCSLGLTLQDLGLDNSSEEDKDEDYKPHELQTFGAVSEAKSSLNMNCGLKAEPFSGHEIKKEKDDSDGYLKASKDGGRGKTPVTSGLQDSPHEPYGDLGKKRGRPKGSKDKVERKKKKGNLCFDAYSDDESVTKLRKSLKLGDSEKKKKPSVPQGPLLRVNGSVSNPLTCTVINTRDCDVIEKGSSKRRNEAVYEKSAGGVAVLPFPLSDTVPWLCCFCGQVANHLGLGDLFGPYWPDNYQPDPADTINSGPSSPPQLSPAEPFKKRRRRRDSGSSEPGPRKRRNSKLSSSPSGCIPERWVHIECAVWSHGVYILGGSIHGLEEAAAVAAQTVCSTCHCSGATLGCITKGCTDTYHYLCAQIKGCFLDEENFSLVCPKHKER